MTQLQAIKASIRHHEENLRKLKETKGEFAIAPYMEDYHFTIGQVEINISADACALCKKYEGCSNCPLFKIGNSCKERTSTWRRITDATTRGEAILAETEMVKVLRGLLKKG